MNSFEASKSASALADRLRAHLPGPDVSELIADFDNQGFCVIPGLLDAEALRRQRQALAPWIEQGPKGRNVFEGTRTHRVYAMLAKDPIFSELIAHPVSLAWAEHYLGESCLLSACLAICLHPGESAQPWHTDDDHTSLTPSNDSFGISTFRAPDYTTL